MKKAQILSANVLVTGDAMLDRYWFGDAERISPEAPVPVVRVVRSEERLGGAANVALNIAHVGARATLLSVVGEDAAGRRIGSPDKRDTDAVVTTRELAAWAKARAIDFSALEPCGFDHPLGEASGAGVIFGNTGGVMEAALRTAYRYVTGEHAPAERLSRTPVRGLEGDMKEATVRMGDLDVRVAVLYGTARAGELLDKMKKEGGLPYHFVEVMNCPGGCIGGGGQPNHMGDAAQNAAR